MKLRHYSLFVMTVVAYYFDHICCLPPRPNAIECSGIKLTKLGCFEDSMKKPRPLPQLVFTDRDTTSPVYSGVLIRWRAWDDYMRKLICRCAAQSLAKGYDKIGIQHYGECWSGPKSATLGYARDGPSRNCITYGGKPCKGGLDCIGEDNANFVYDVKKDKPSPTNKPTSKKTTPKRTTKPRPTPSKTPSPTPSPSPNPSSPSPSSPPTSRLSPTPSGSATSTAKRPSSKPKSSGPSKPTSSNPCQSTSCPGTGKQQPCQYPPCLPQQPVAYPGVITVCPQPQCPTNCAPQCALSCCNSFK